VLLQLLASFPRTAINESEALPNLILWPLRRLGRLHVTLSGKMYLHNLCEISDVAEKTTRTSWGRGALYLAAGGT